MANTGNQYPGKPISHWFYIQFNHRCKNLIVPLWCRFMAIHGCYRLIEFPNHISYYVFYRQHPHAAKNCVTCKWQDRVLTSCTKYYLFQSQIGWNFNSKAKESYCLYNSGPMTWHYSITIWMDSIWTKICFQQIRGPMEAIQRVYIKCRIISPGTVNIDKLSAE